MSFRAFLAARTPEISTFLYMQFQLVRPLILSLARGSDGGPRRCTEVMLNKQALPVAGMKLSRSQDATSALPAKPGPTRSGAGSHPGAPEIFPGSLI